EALQRVGLTREALANSYTALVTACEQAKIALSTAEKTAVGFEAGGKTHNGTITAREVETLHKQKRIFPAQRPIHAKGKCVGRQRGIFKEDVSHVLMVGGTSLMPSVQRLMGQYFSESVIRADRPFTAIAEGALQIAAGLGLEDQLIHSYGIRYLDQDTGTHQ